MVGRWRMDGEVPGSNPALTAVISLSKKFVPHLLLSTQVYKWVPVSEIANVPWLPGAPYVIEDLDPSDRGVDCEVG
ncbi:hypothetical protein DPMN_019169 [Dreissena polymorpha]|uniref:Uncharacterized protein n=1 Tax=Dreissena polymorpha TaxID=45954 RepID=A0A9D4NK79_DREPO|nr:hypothetical protein DPMN_019169 [Dreissena polymorpha]